MATRRWYMPARGQGVRGRRGIGQGRIWRQDGLGGAAAPCNSRAQALRLGLGQPPVPPSQPPAACCPPASGASSPASTASSTSSTRATPRLGWYRASPAARLAMAGIWEKRPLWLARSSVFSRYRSYRAQGRRRSFFSTCGGRVGAGGVRAGRDAAPRPPLNL
jgi:hypothetical protein